MILLWHAHDISYQVSFDLFFSMYILTQEEHFKENSSPSRHFSQIIKAYLITC